MTSEILTSLTQQALKQIFWYDPKSGFFYWRHTKCYTVKPWDKAGTFDGKYCRIRVGQERFFAHRLAWLYMTGSHPTNQIDHINGIKIDNSWANLREATNKQNQENRRLSKTNKSGVAGVYKSGCKWRAKITSFGVVYHSERFKFLHEAAQWRLKKEQELFTHHINTQKEST
jgi:hypothetical protein